MRLLPIAETTARRILSPVSGFLNEAGFTHSLTPARNCTYGCTYCYVPSMRIQAGLRQEDWENWGDYTIFKTNSPALLARELRPEQIIYCSPLVDPYQPAEMSYELMPRLLEQIYIHPPRSSPSKPARSTSCATCTCCAPSPNTPTCASASPSPPTMIVSAANSKPVATPFPRAWKPCRPCAKQA